MAPEPGLLPAGEVAARLGVTRQTVHTYARKGLLPATRLPSGVYRFREQDIAEFIAHGAVGPSPDGDQVAAADAS